MSPCVDISSSTSAFRRACWYSDSIFAAEARWSRCWVSRLTFWFASSASPADDCSSASRSASVTSGFESSRMTVSGFTTAPGRTTIFSTRPSVVAGIQRTSSGTSVPGPRTSRSIEPRLTVSTRTDARSTPGTAGPRRESPSVTRRTPVIPAAPKRRRRRLRFTSSASPRGMSMSRGRRTTSVPGEIQPPSPCRRETCRCDRRAGDGLSCPPVKRRRPEMDAWFPWTFSRLRCSFAGQVPPLWRRHGAARSRHSLVAPSVRARGRTREPSLGSDRRQRADQRAGRHRVGRSDRERPSVDELDQPHDDDRGARGSEHPRGGVPRILQYCALWLRSVLLRQREP